MPMGGETKSRNLFHNIRAPEENHFLWTYIGSFFLHFCFLRTSANLKKDHQLTQCDLSNTNQPLNCCHAQVKLFLLLSAEVITLNFKSYRPFNVSNSLSRSKCSPPSEII